MIDILKIMHKKYGKMEEEKPSQEAPNAEELD